MGEADRADQGEADRQAQGFRVPPFEAERQTEGLQAAPAVQGLIFKQDLTMMLTQACCPPPPDPHLLYGHPGPYLQKRAERTQPVRGDMRGAAPGALAPALLLDLDHHRPAGLLHFRRPALVGRQAACFNQHSGHEGCLLCVYHGLVLVLAPTSAACHESLLAPAAAP